MAGGFGINPPVLTNQPVSKEPAGRLGVAIPGILHWEVRETGKELNLAAAPQNVAGARISNFKCVR
jgi:hypothetical protein